MAKSDVPDLKRLDFSKRCPHGNQAGRWCKACAAEGSGPAPAATGSAPPAEKPTAASGASNLPDVGNLDPGQARELTDRVRDDADALWRNLRRLYDGGAHLALGYAAWGDYFAAEFGKSRSYGYRLLKASTVAAGLQSPMGDSPLTERQVRELAKADDPAAALAEAAAGGAPTAAKIRSVVSGDAPKPLRGEVVHEQLSLLDRWAYGKPGKRPRWSAAAEDAGYSFEEWAEAVLDAACAG